MDNIAPGGSRGSANKKIKTVKAEYYTMSQKMLGFALPFKLATVSAGTMQSESTLELTVRESVRWSVLTAQ